MGRTCAQPSLEDGDPSTMLRMVPLPRFAGENHSRQCENSTGTVDDVSRQRVTPPKIHSRMRVWP
jgi:hypothetical protein